MREVIRFGWISALWGFRHALITSVIPDNAESETRTDNCTCKYIYSFRFLITIFYSIKFPHEFQIWLSKNLQFSKWWDYFCMSGPPYWKRHFEFLNFECIFIISDVENPWIPSFIQIEGLSSNLVGHIGSVILNLEISKTQTSYLDSVTQKTLIRNTWKLFERLISAYSWKYWFLHIFQEN